MAHTGYYHLEVQIIDCHVMINSRNCFDQPIKSYIKAYDKVKKKYWLMR